MNRLQTWISFRIGKASDLQRSTESIESAVPQLFSYLLNRIINRHAHRLYTINSNSRIGLERKPYRPAIPRTEQTDHRSGSLSQAVKVHNSIAASHSSLAPGRGSASWPAI